MSDIKISLIALAWVVAVALIATAIDPMMSFFQYALFLFALIGMPMCVLTYLKWHAPSSAIDWFASVHPANCGKIGEYFYEKMNLSYGPTLQIKVSKFDVEKLDELPYKMHYERTYYGDKNEAEFRLLPFFQYDGVFYNWEDFLKARRNSRFGPASIAKVVRSVLIPFR